MPPTRRRCAVALLAALAGLSPRVTRAAEEDVRARGDSRTSSSDEDREHTIVVGAGGAAEIELADGTAHAGANVMVEWEAIEDWLELELGVSVLSAAGGLAVPVDLLAKKPFKLARWAEMMIGAGPEIVQLTGANRGTYFGGEVALDFMFWPCGRRVGLWIEPEYDLVFHDGASSGIGATGGVLFAW